MANEMEKRQLATGQTPCTPYSIFLGADSLQIKAVLTKRWTTWTTNYEGLENSLASQQIKNSRLML
jgi:hypothetical protein